MAIRTLMLRKKLSDAQKELEALRGMTADFETRKAELEKREAELESAIEEASSEEEKAVVGEEVDKFEADQASLESEISENDQKISDLEGEISEMERELSEIEENQRAVPQAPAHENTEPETRKTERKYSKMLRTKSLRQMSIQERDAFVNSDEAQELVAEIRSAIKNKRAITGGAYTISETIIGLLREDVMDYSKLYKHVNVVKLSGKGREIVMGTTPEAIWEECCDPIYELDQAFTQVELDCYKLAGYFAVCNALLEDSDIDLLDALMVSLNASMGYALDKAILYGKGSTDKMPTGVVTALAADDTLDDTNIITISSANSTGIKLFQQLILAASKTANRYARGEKVWVMSEGTYATILSESVAVNAAGAIVSEVNGRMPVTGGIIEVLNFVPAKNIVAGYFELYVLGERKGFTIDTSEHVKFIEDQTVIRGRCRYDGKPAIPAAFVLIGIDNETPTEAIDFATAPDSDGGEG